MDVFINVSIVDMTDGVVQKLSYDGEEYVRCDGASQVGDIIGKEPDIKAEKRRARPGERILVTKAFNTEGLYSNGDILTVKEYNPDQGVSVEEFDDIYLLRDEYEVVVENYSEEEKTFSKGDYVKIVGDTRWDDFKLGEYARVVSGWEDADGEFRIEQLDKSDYDYAPGSSLERVILSDNDVALLKVGRKSGEYKAGDIVRVVGQVYSRDYKIGSLYEIKDIFETGANLIGDDNYTRPYLYYEEIELICPVENRVDKDVT